MMADDPIARLIQRWRNDADYDPDQASAYTWSKCASELEAAVQAALRASPPPDKGIATLIASMLSPDNENVKQGYWLAALRDVAQILVTSKDNAKEAMQQLEASKATVQFDPHEAFVSGYLGGQFDSQRGLKRADDAWQGWSSAKAEVLRAVRDGRRDPSEAPHCLKHGDPLICLACEAEEDARPEWQKPHRVTPPRLQGEPERPAESHRCSGCGHRWIGELTGAELCGDCWRKAQPVVHRDGRREEPAK